MENHCNKLNEKSKTLQLRIRLQLTIIFVRPKQHLATQVTSPPGCRPVKFDSKRVWRLREAMGAMMLHEKQKDLKPVSLGWLAEGSSTWPRGHNLPMLPRFSTTHNCFSIDIWSLHLQNWPRLRVKPRRLHHGWQSSNSVATKHGRPPVRKTRQMQHFLTNQKTRIKM